MQKTAIIIPYYGKWPEWMDLYLYSCSKNPQLDFLIITDIETPHKVYSNTHFIYMTFEERLQPYLTDLTRKVSSERSIFFLCMQTFLWHSVRT